MAEPIDRQVVHHHDEPGGERTVGIDAARAATEAGEVVVAQGLAHSCEHVHDFVGLGGVVADRAEDETAVALDEEIPSSFGITRLERSDPGFHHGPSGPREFI